MKKVIIIEDQAAVREMIAEVVVSDAQYEVVGEENNGQSAYERCLKLKPDLIILDIMLPGLSGTEILRRITKKLKKIRVIVFSAYYNIDLLEAVLKAGAHGFVEKNASLSELRQGIHIVANGGSYFGPAVTRTLREAVANPNGIRQTSITRLTTRERETLQLIAEGYTTREIAKKLDVSVKTADNHRTNMMRKLKLHRIAVLTRYAIKHQLIENPVTEPSSKIMNR